MTGHKVCTEIMDVTVSSSFGYRRTYSPYMRILAFLLQNICHGEKMYIYIFIYYIYIYYMYLHKVNCLLRHRIGVAKLTDSSKRGVESSLRLSLASILSFTHDDTVASQL